MAVNPWSSVGNNNPPAGSGATMDGTAFGKEAPVKDPASQSKVKMMKAVGLPGKVGRPNNSIKSMTRLMTKQRKPSLKRGW